MPQHIRALPDSICACPFASSELRYKFTLISPKYFWEVIRTENIVNI